VGNICKHYLIQWDYHAKLTEDSEFFVWAAQMIRNNGIGHCYYTPKSTPQVAGFHLVCKFGIKGILNLSEAPNTYRYDEMCKALRLAVLGTHTHIRKILLDSGADVNYGSGLASVLHQASAQRCGEMVKVFIKFGANVNDQDYNGYPLHDYFVYKSTHKSSAPRKRLNRRRKSGC
jgi:hypothetical protein